MRLGTVVVGLVVAVGCSSGPGEAPPADVAVLGTTTTSADATGPPIVIGATPGPDGHLPVRLNPFAFRDISAELRADPVDPFHDLHSEGHVHFFFGVELHPVVGPGWTGEIGTFTTDCEENGICVRFDPDGGVGPVGTLTARATGEIEIQSLDPYRLILRNLIFVRTDGGPSYRIEEVTIDTTR